jgi:hypothetical protein
MIKKLYQSSHPSDSYKGNEGLNPDACNPIMDHRELPQRNYVVLQIKKNPDKKFPKK